MIKHRLETAPQPIGKEADCAFGYGCGKKRKRSGKEP
jgi:hypothetical protein